MSLRWLPADPEKVQAGGTLARTLPRLPRVPTWPLFLIQRV